MLLGPANTTGISCGEIHDGKSDNKRNLTISWETKEDFPDNTSHYVVGVLSWEKDRTEIEHLITQEHPEFTKKQLAVEVNLGTEYQFRVRTVNCGGILVGKEATKTVLLNGM